MIDNLLKTYSLLLKVKEAAAIVLVIICHICKIGRLEAFQIILGSLKFLWCSHECSMNVFMQLVRNSLVDLQKVEKLEFG